MRCMSQPNVTIWFDGACPLCLREIGLMRRLDRRGAISFLDIGDSAARTVSCAGRRWAIVAWRGGLCGHVARHSTAAPAWHRGALAAGIVGAGRRLSRLPSCAAALAGLGAIKRFSFAV